MAVQLSHLIYFKKTIVLNIKSIKDSYLKGVDAFLIVVENEELGN